MELWWEELANGKSDDIPVHLAVKNGRWRVGCGGLCTMRAEVHAGGRVASSPPVGLAREA